MEGGAYADRAAERRLAGVPPAERRLAMELAYGCIRLRSRLDTELTELADRPLSRLDGPVLLWLRLGLYQLHETRVPGHAAVHESVEGVRRSVGTRAAGFANAVLRPRHASIRPSASPCFRLWKPTWSDTCRRSDPIPSGWCAAGSSATPERA